MKEYYTTLFVYFNVPNNFPSQNEKFDAPSVNAINSSAIALNMFIHTNHQNLI